MLFHVTHTHGYETCIAHDEKSKSKLIQTIFETEVSGVKVWDAFSDPPGHQIFIIIESDSMEQLVKFLDPIIDIGDYDVRPVLNLRTAVENLSNN